MNSNPFNFLSNIIYHIFFSITFIYFGTDLLNAQELILKEIQNDSTTKFDEKSSDLPTNPFEIVEKIRRANSLNDATLPTDAIDDALKSFYFNEEENI